MPARSTIFPAAGVCLLLAAVTGPAVTGAHAQADLSKLGTLTCTTKEAPQRAAADARLSCNLAAADGTEVGFTGHITRKGPADLPPGRRVLVWTVLAPSNGVEPQSLAGTYKGETGGAARGRLAGGKGGSIVLEPVTVTSQVGDQPTPSVLELRLEAVRA